MTHPLLSRGYAPLRAEYDDVPLRIEGALPPAMAGAFYRTGPNPQFEPRQPYNPLNGDGMVHAFRIADGTVTYRNRWVRTRQFVLDRAADRALFSTTGVPSLHDESVQGVPTDGVANTALAWHGGRLFALEEAHLPIEIDPVSLETIGPCDFGGALARVMTAHPKIDPASGEMVTFANAPAGRFTGEIALYTIAPDGSVTHATAVQGPFGAMVHDIAITKRSIVLVVSPSTVSFRRAMSGGPGIAWEPELGCHLGVLPRGAEGSEVRWKTLPARMVWHVMNAFEDGEALVLDLCEQDAAMFPFADGRPPVVADARQRFVRWTLAGGEVTVRTLDEGPCEYPRHDERFVGRPYRYGYLTRVGGPGTDDPFQRGLGVWDHRAERLATWNARPTEAVGEAVFAPRAPDAEEGDGWLLTTIHDEETDTGSLAVFDARDIGRGPIARAHAEHRIPMGFHALWKPD